MQVDHEQMLEESEKRRQAFIAEHRSEWKTDGEQYRNARLIAGITLKQMQEMTGFSSSKCADFERGFPITHRRAIQTAYANALRMRVRDIHDTINNLA